MAPDDREQIRAAVAARYAGLGCGNPVAVADLHPGETVLDLGCGGGRPARAARRSARPAQCTAWT